MHELSLIANLFEIMEKEAREKKAKKITHVRLQVGLFSGVVSDLLKTAFDIYKEDTMASEAQLEIEEIPLKIRCQDCGTEVIKDDFVFICGKCGSHNLQTLSGTELFLEKMDLLI
jgi:hydrogenase nickel incorporation protein HypA/HybF